MRQTTYMSLLQTKPSLNPKNELIHNLNKNKTGPNELQHIQLEV